MEVKNWRVVYEGQEAFVLVNDVKVAKRGSPGASTWISLEPGWTVRDVQGTYGLLEIQYNGEKLI